MKSKLSKEEKEWWNRMAKKCILPKPIETAFRRNPATNKIEEERWR